MNPAIIATVLKIWPLVGAVAGFVYFASKGDFASATQVLGLGGAASASGHVLHQLDPPKS